MKITMLSVIDYAGSGHKLCEAISQHTEHDIAIFTGKYYNPYGHPENFKWNRKDVQRRIDESDIVHLKGDVPPHDGYMGLRIMHKPIVITVGGSHFRSTKHGGYSKYKNADYKSAQVRTAFTPDLCYKGYSDIWTPHPIDCLKTDKAWEQKEPPIVMHIPTRREVKGTDFVFDVFGGLKEVMDVTTLVVEDMPFRRVIQERKRATIYFDQFKVGFYGNSAIEAMAYGIPVAAWIRPDVIPEGCPVITADKDVDTWVEMIHTILTSKNLVDAYSTKTKSWCDERHSYESVAAQWKNIYGIVEI